MIDIVMCNLALVMAYLIAHNLSPSLINVRNLSINLIVLTIINASVFFNFKTYSGIVRYTGVQDAARIVLSLTVSTSVLFAFSFLTLANGISLIELPIVTILVYSILSFLALVSYRVAIKYSFTYLRNMNMAPRMVIIYGAGQAGISTKRVLESDPNSKVKVLAFIDDDARKVNKVIDGVSICGFSELESIVGADPVDEIIISSFSIPASRRTQLVDFCMEHKITVLNVPPIEQWINGQFTKKQLRTIKIEQLLERDSIQLNHQELANQISNRRILVTGAAGSIGSEIVRQLLKYNPAAIIACDQAETPLHELELELGGLQHNSSMIYYLADIRNCNRMEALFNEFQPQIVYHAAAYKHVPMMEISPTEAIMTNVRGTKRMAEFAIKYNVQRFVMVSTDKAVNPTNVMGASKRLAEIFVQALSAQPGHQTKFITTRFGNVLGSNGSVINRFKDQIAKGGPVTVTHPGIIRYFMTIPEATQLVLEAGSMGNGGEIFVFDMGKPVAIVELARKMIRLSGLVPGIDIEIKYTGLRPGEKLYEELLNDAENTLPTHHEKILIAKVRTQNMDAVNASFDSLFELAKDPMATMQLVAKMKEIVPEFVSNNSVYEKLDQEKSNLASVRKLA